MALSPDSTWTAEADKMNSGPVYLANLEYDYLKAGVTYGSEFRDGTGTADTETKDGKVILQKTAGTDILSSSSYTTKTFTMDLIDGSKLISGVRIVVNRKTKFYSCKIKCKVDTGSCYMGVSLHRCDDNISSGNSATVSSFNLGSNMLTNWYAPVSGLVQNRFLITTTNTEFTVQAETNDFVNSSYPYTKLNYAVLEKGTYALIFTVPYPDEGQTITFDVWNPDDLVFNTSIEKQTDGDRSLYGFRDNGIQLGHFFTFSSNEGLTSPAAAPPTGEHSYISEYTDDSFDGYLFLKDFKVDTYANSTYTTPWMRVVKNSDGSNTTPTASGLVKLDYSKPINTAITFVLWWATDSSGTGATSLGAVTDGTAVSTLKDYYQIVCTMTTTDWFSTPEINSLSVYFKLTNDYCKSDDYFQMSDGSPARPYLDAIPSYETRIDPINNKVSFSQPAIDLIIQKIGMSKTQSDIETLIETYHLTGKELAITLGYRGVSSTYFLPYQTGTTDNQVWINEQIYSIECKDPFFKTKDPFLIDSADTFQPYFLYQNPIDIMLALISMSGVPQRNIDTSSFSSIKSSYFTGWEFFRPYDEPIKDIKKELDEMSQLTGCVAVTKEDGKIYCVKLDNAAGTVAKKSADSQTFNDRNSKAVGKANIDLSKRVNVCSVQRGYWIEPSDIESKDVEYWNTEIDEESIANVGRSDVLKIENKWIPKDTAISGVNLSSLVAQRMVARFRYGLWTLKRSTDLSFAFIQVGDQVTLLTSQILYKGFYGEKSVRGVVIAKEVRPSAKEYEGEIIWTIWIYQNISATLEPEPTAQPTALVFSAVDDNEITLTWTAASPAPTGYVVLFATDNYPNTLPEDGVQYTAGDTINDATVAYRGTGVTFTHSSLSSNTEYFYKIFSYNDSGTAVSTNYNKINPLIDSRYTMATAPGAQPTTIVFGTFSDDTNTTLTWTDSVTSPLADGHIVLRSTAATPDTAPTDGTGYDVGDTLGNATVVYSGTVAGSTGFTDTGIAFTGITYYYAIHGFRGSDPTSYNYLNTSPLTGNKASTVSEPTAQPASLSGESTTTTEMDLIWSAASPAVTGYVVGYKKAAASTGVPVDNTDYTVGGAPFGDMSVGYSGTGTSCTVTGLTAGQYYIFKVFSYNGASPNKNYLTVSPPSFYDVVS